jgi:hypothetical protein
MILPKWHHYVPEMLQKNFVDEDDRLWTFDGRNRGRGIWRSSYETLFLEGNSIAISIRNARKILTGEIFLGSGKRAAPVTRKIIDAARRDSCPGLTKAERLTWDVFFYKQSRRVPDLFASLMTSNSIATKLSEFWMSWSAPDGGLTNQERRELLDPDALRRMGKNLRVAALKTGSDNGPKVIGVRGIVIGRVDNFKKPFVLGSRPVVKLTPVRITGPSLVDRSFPR